MQFSQEILQQAAISGSQKVASAFAKISGAKAEVVASEVKTVTANEALEKIKPQGEYSIVVYAQLLDAVSGASFLIVPRESALALVDLLNQQPVGTTGILKDIDRSALKEILNILSNSYMTSLSETANITIGLGVPTMITADRLTDNIGGILTKGEDNPSDTAVVFETVTTIAQYKVVASIYIIFSQSVLELIAQ